MYKKILFFLVLLITCSCSTFTPAENRKTFIYGESSPDIDIGQQRIFSTMGPSWIIVNQYTTTFIDCSYIFLHNGDYIEYSAKNGDLYYDEMGFKHFSWYVNTIKKIK